MVVSTDSTTPVAAGGSLKEEVLVASIGANATVEHEVSNNLIRGMDLTVVDDLAAAKSDTAISSRLVRRASLVGKISCLWKSLSPKARRSHGQNASFFQSNGIADEDLAVGKYVLDQAKRKKMKLREVTEI